MVVTSIIENKKENEVTEEIWQRTEKYSNMIEMLYSNRVRVV